MNKEICPKCSNTSAFHNERDAVTVADCKTCDGTGLVTSEHKQLLDLEFKETFYPTESKLSINQIYTPLAGSSKQLMSITITRKGDDLHLSEYKIENIPYTHDPNHEITIVDIINLVKNLEA